MKVSVVIPVYKAKIVFLHACFDSLVAQTMRDCEFIVVSDGAPEIECSVCEEYTKKDSRFKFFKREHAGVSATRNYGIDQAQGEYITFVDCDDWLEADSCQTIYDYAKKNNSDVAFGDLSFEKNSKKKNRASFNSISKSLLSPNELIFFQENIIHAQHYNFLISVLPSCKIFKAELIKQNNLYFNTALVRGEDRVFNYQITLHANRFSYLHKILYHYRVHNSSTEHSYHEKGFNDLLKFIQKLDDLSGHAYPQSIGNETISCFFSCIYKLFQQDISLSQVHHELTFLKKQIKSESFHSLIQRAQSPNWTLLERIEVFFMKRKISLLFVLLVTKALAYHFYLKLNRLVDNS
ncbi:glycosyltransferase [Candidatus Saccharibacteria bacterium]|nr:glycosyltransferase [Candidatus Saccharibacteria bacterium]